MRFAAYFPSAISCYLTVMDLVANKLFDFSSNTWVTFPSATTPNIAAPQVNIGINSIYTADINLKLLFPSDSQRHSIAVVFYEQVGSGVSLTTDTVKQIWPLTVCCGHQVPDDPANTPFTVDVTCNLTNIGGTNMRVTAELTCNGVTIPLHTLDTGATCSALVTQDAPSTGANRSTQFSLSTGTIGAANTSSRFECDYANPALNAETGYTCVCTITAGGVTYVGNAKFSTF